MIIVKIDGVILVCGKMVFMTGWGKLAKVLSIIKFIVGLCR